MNINIAILILASMLFGALCTHYLHQEPTEVAEEELKQKQPSGFFDIKTGGLVDIDPVTKKEVPVR